ncbi:hypothetical protein K491DRAFT_778157 [Lophiostoma macrostomum CBS 122681]|uniref:Uncharacterized protein n=1 Tax=Lophiostoma macrostomum CBS 122681 TaxID=1314788 RepID=A0A6A6TBC6_9PLEO|nr:hypothetical protein K491DRAFT_778157 [Lophiostoma macrostomum CBS 122681]
MPHPHSQPARHPSKPTAKAPTHARLMSPEEALHGYTNRDQWSPNPNSPTWSSSVTPYSPVSPIYHEKWVGAGAGAGGGGGAGKGFRNSEPTFPVSPIRLSGGAKEDIERWNQGRERLAREQERRDAEKEGGWRNQSVDRDREREKEGERDGERRREIASPQPFSAIIGQAKDVYPHDRTHAGGHGHGYGVGVGQKTSTSTLKSTSYPHARDETPPLPPPPPKAVVSAVKAAQNYPAFHGRGARGAVQRDAGTTYSHAYPHTQAQTQSYTRTNAAEEEMQEERVSRWDREPHERGRERTAVGGLGAGGGGGVPSGSGSGTGWDREPREREDVRRYEPYLGEDDRDERERCCCVVM